MISEYKRAGGREIQYLNKMKMVSGNGVVAFVASKKRTNSDDDYHGGCQLSINLKVTPKGRI